MGTFKRNGRDHGADRRRNGNGALRRGPLNFESLEERTLLSTGVTQPSAISVSNVQSGPMANSGQTLISVYEAYLKGSSPKQLAAAFPLLEFQGNGVAVTVKGTGTGDFNTFVSSLTDLGFQVGTSSTEYNLVEGAAPLASLLSIAQLPQVRDVTPTETPYYGFVGKGDNEGETALQANTARTASGVDGTGQVVGVLSDSVSQFQGGLADSVATGDLPNNVKVIQDGPAGSTDEGRAMLENVHDIAPGAGLEFATAAGGQVGFANNILALAAAGSTVITDDVTYPLEPYFQDGAISQAINTVVGENIPYDSSAGNAADQGYLSNFRGVKATVPGIGTGTFMNFDPTGKTTTTELPITVGSVDPNTGVAPLVFQFDQPYSTYETGTAPGPSSEVDFYVLDSSGNVAFSSTNNNVMTGIPEQDVAITAPGNYTVVIEVVSGPNPGHVEFVNPDENANVTVSQQFGTGAAAGNTFYPTSIGHHVTANNIGVGAVPWWAAPPYLNQQPLASEPYSSFGPGITALNPDGSALAAPVTVLSPVVSGPDGGNTSFFGQVIDTSTPPFPGEPATATNLSQDLPSFFGTSSAAPNIAAVVALMKQKSPSLTVPQVRAALIASAEPMNGSAAGVWNAQAGFGFVDAVTAVATVAPLSVTTTTPGPGSTVGTAPAQVVVTFSQAVNFSTVSAADLIFTTLPAGVASVTVGTPIAVDNATQPTEVAFPVTYNLKPGQTANGLYDFTVDGSITSVNGKTLTPYTTGSFSVLDVTPPHVIGTTINGRVISVQFDKPLAPTLSPQTIFVALTNAQGVVEQNLDLDPGFKMSYNAVTNTVVLDYSGLNQSELPTGYYKLVALSTETLANGTVQQGITDTSGIPLDGTFYGVFPSGYNPSISGPVGPFTDFNFDDFLGLETVQAPVISSVKLTPATDSGIQGDENTNDNSPQFIGQVTNTFPGTISGVTIEGEFNGLHGGNLNLTPVDGRGSQGSVDVTATTDANGTFTIPGASQPVFLPEGFQTLQLVAIGQADTPVLPGFSSMFDHSFRIDVTPPQVVSATLSPVTPDVNSSLPLGSTYSDVAALSTLSLDVEDPASPNNGPFATPASVIFPALNPGTASNISNYTLKQILPNGLSIDESKFITGATFVATGADFVSAPARASSSDPYFGRIDLTIAPGLPAGLYQFIAHTAEGNFTGLTDAAGNPLNETNVPGEGTPDFFVSFNLQPQPVFITSVSTNEANAQGNTLLPYSYYEINPRAGDDAANPPTTFYVDFSAPIDPSTVNNNSIQLIGSALDANGVATGDFGDFGEGGLGSTGTGFVQIAGTTVKLVDGPNGTDTRLVLQLAPGTTLPANHYRFYIPNNSASLVLRDVYHNQLDGEFLGNPTATGATDLNGNPAYEDQLPDGEFRAGMSGDGVGGGSFTAGFEVVPSGNVIYARPGYVENPLSPSTEPNGSIAQPYAVLAPQADVNSLPAAAQATLDNGDPNGGLNDTSNFTDFNPNDDKADIHQFARSAFYAASQLAMVGPVVIVALPGTPQRDPVTGAVSQQTFVLQAPAGANPAVNDGSASVPFDTTLVFNAGSTLKLQNASLFVQNQGSALQTIGGTNLSEHVTFTSVDDNTVGANPNGPAGDSTPEPGDWGGIVFRNFDDNTVTSNGVATTRTDTFPVDGTLIGPGGTAAVSGADDSLSEVTFTDVRYGGGAVPATQGVRYDSITLYNSRPEIAQDSISLSATSGGTGSQAAISADLDSFREDDTRRGPLIRRVSVSNNSLNGILIRADLSGAAEVTDAEVYPDNPVIYGGMQNYTFDAPLPYILTSPLILGTEVLSDTAQLTAPVTDRIYMQPGTIFKFQRGAGIEVVNPGASINVGERAYIAGFDSDATLDPQTGLVSSTYGPLLPNGSPNPAFQDNPAGAQPVIFTSLYDNKATTAIVPMVDSANTAPTSTFGNPGPIDPLQPTPGNVPALARWGSITIASGAVASIDQSLIEFGGGSLNIAGGTIVRNVLSILGSAETARLTTTPGGVTTTTINPGLGGRVSITDDNFDSNSDAPIYVDPNALLATNPLTPLSSGHPFFRGNVLTNNNDNAVAIGYGEGSDQDGFVSNTTIWDQTDITYLLRGTIIADPPVFNVGNFVTGIGVGGVVTPPALGPIPTPSLVLTIQSALPGTLLADNSKIANPGASVIVKLLGSGAGSPVTGQNALGIGAAETDGGAGFLFGVDDGKVTNPPPDLLGLNSQLRILGIGGDETTGQARVPVIITSANDSTVGPTVRGVLMNQVIPGDTNAPAAGDGGVIAFGADSLTTYNAFDIREGNKIDNADIKYITRIEMQGGGNIVTTPVVVGGSGLATDIEDEKAGVFPPLANGQPNPNDGFIQANAPKELTISDSNFSTFSQDGVLEQPGFDLIVDGVRDVGIRGEPNQLFMYNNTIANMPVGVRVVSDMVDNILSPEPQELLLLNNTFFNDAIGTDVIADAADGVNSNSSVTFVGMDNIYSNSATAGIQSVNQTQGSVLEYNLFFQNGADVTGPLAGVNFQPVDGNPAFANAAAGDFNLTAGSAAIDAARSELDLNDTSTGAFVGALVPLDNQVLSMIGGIRNTNNRQPNSFNDGQALVSNELTLPGYGSMQPSLRGYVDEFEAALPGTAGAVAGPASSAATFDYVPISGERDVLGNLRQKDPASSNIGFGSRPYFDIGAFEFRVFTPPHVTGVTATLASGSTVNLYAVGTFAGTNQPIQTIQVTFDDPINPNTINGQSVILEATNGTGNFNNPIFFNLSGKLSLDSTDRILTINIGAAGLVLNNDEFRLILNGTGQNVITDSKGLALDGQNTLNDNPNNPQLPLPSGSGAPGTNFFDTFIINTTAPTIVPGSLMLDPTTDSNVVGDSVTNFNAPSFEGTVAVSNSSIVPVAGLTVELDVSTLGNGKFNIIDAGTALTTAGGAFVVTVGKDGANTGLVNTTTLPDSVYNVGPNGILKSGTDNSGYTWFRIRVIDQSGNASDQVTDPLSDFIANNALTADVIDTAPPTITSFSPSPNTVIQPSNGVVTFSFTTNKNIYQPSLTTGSILVTAGGVAVPINPLSITVTPLGNQPPNGSRLGPELITFTVNAATLTSNVYTVTLKGSGATPITDIAGNPLAGNGTTAGTDFSSQFILKTTTPNLIYVNAAATPTALAPADGTIENPFETIGAAMAVALPGDIVAVLPGVYTENVILAPFVKLESASPTSTDTTLVPGNALQTVIRAPEPAATSTAPLNATILAANLPYIPGADDVVAGFTITSPLTGTLDTPPNPAGGTVDPDTAAIEIENANVLLQGNYIINANIGVYVVATSGTGVLMPRVFDNVIAGNNVGLQIDDEGSNTIPHQALVDNNDFVYNTVGLFANNLPTSPLLATVANDIFWENHDQTSARNGFGILANSPNSLGVINSLFQGNGSSDTSPIDAGVNVGNGFVAANLKATPDAHGNITGNPSFVFPIDPRPGSDGPAAFALDANFDLQSNSAAIDAANETYAPATDLLNRGRVRIANRGFAGTGPADIGAFEFHGTGGSTVISGAFRVATTSLSTTGAATTNGSDVYTAQTAPKTIAVTFSAPVNRATVTPSTLLVYGGGVSALGGVRATSVTFTSPTTAVFTLSGNYSSSGSVGIKVNPGTIKSTSGATIQGFADSFKITSTLPTKPVTTKPTTPVTTKPTTPVTTKPTKPVTPPPAVAPKAVVNTKPTVIVHTAPITPAPAAPPTSAALKAPKGPLAVRKVAAVKKK